MLDASPPTSSAEGPPLSILLPSVSLGSSTGARLGPRPDSNFTLLSDITARAAPMSAAAPFSMASCNQLIFDFGKAGFEHHNHFRYNLLTFSIDFRFWQF